MSVPAAGRVIPIQVGGSDPIDTDGMSARVEDLLESALGRLRF
jgi:hypothetical protein